MKISIKEKELALGEYAAEGAVYLAARLSESTSVKPDEGENTGSYEKPENPSSGAGGTSTTNPDTGDSGVHVDPTDPTNGTGDSSSSSTKPRDEKPGNPSSGSGSTSTTNPGTGDNGVQPPAESDPAYPSTTTTTSTTVDVPEEMYTVIYNLNGGMGHAPEQSVAIKGEPIELAVLDDPKSCYKIDHTFDGWNTEPDGSGYQYCQGEVVSFYSTIVLYAQFTYAID